MATQVVEAGVDISADVLVTELAPWASLVQRFGRCARYGGKGRILVIDWRHTDESAQNIKATDDERARKRKEADRATARPYDLAEIEASADAILNLGGAAGPSAFERFEKSEEEKNEMNILLRLYPYAPLHVLTRRELLDLFDTGPDLTGADIDISRFVREGDERDVTIWWCLCLRINRRTNGSAPRTMRFVAFPPATPARGYLSATGAPRTSSPTMTGPVLVQRKLGRAPGCGATSIVAGSVSRNATSIRGRLSWSMSSAGGYDSMLALGGSRAPFPLRPAHASAIDAAEAADGAGEQEDLSEGLGDSSWQYKTIATHAAQVANDG